MDFIIIIEKMKSLSDHIKKAKQINSINFMSPFFTFNHNVKYCKADQMSCVANHILLLPAIFHSGIYNIDYKLKNVTQWNTLIVFLELTKNLFWVFGLQRKTCVSHYDWIMTWLGTDLCLWIYASWICDC